MDIVHEALKSYDGRYRQLQKALELAMVLVKPRSIYRITPIEKIGTKMILGKGIEIESQRWTRCDWGRRRLMA